MQVEGTQPGDGHDHYWHGLSPAQANGRACVICGQDYLRDRPPARQMPVGRSCTGSPVFACPGACAGRASTLARVLPIPDEALTAAGVVFLEVLDAAGGDLHRAYPDDLVTATVQAAAPFIVAAELRRLTAQAEGDVRGDRWLRHQQLRQRADQLDPAGRSTR